MSINLWWQVKAKWWFSPAKQPQYFIVWSSWNTFSFCGDELLTDGLTLSSADQTLHDQPIYHQPANCRKEKGCKRIDQCCLSLVFQIPIQFDILSYLKKAWFSGRLVLTIPWAVEYLSMMDPLAPHLDYFSGVLYWLQRIYRFLFLVYFLSSPSWWQVMFEK